MANYVDMLLDQLRNGEPVRGPASENASQPEIAQAQQSKESLFFPSGYQYKMPETKLLESGFEKTAKGRAEQIAGLEGRYKGATSEFDQAQEAAKQLMKQQAEIQQPQRSDAADVISMVGPVLAGALLGNQASYLSAEPAMKQSVNLVEGARKEELARQDKMRALIQERLGKQMEMAKLSKDEQKAYLKEMGDIQEKGLSAREKGIKEALDYELEPMRQAQKTKRAEILGPGAKAAESSFGKDYASYILEGGYGNSMSNLQALKQAKSELESNVKTGKFAGLMSKAGVLDFTHPEIASIRDKVRTSIQDTLRATFGPQFTEQEGERLFNAAFNPAFSAQQNVEKINQIIDKAYSVMKAKAEAGEYFMNKGSLVGYKPTAIPTLKSFVDQFAGKQKEDQKQQGPAKQIQEAPAGMTFEQFKKWKAGK